MSSLVSTDFPDDLQVCGYHTPVTTVEEVEFSPQPTDGLIFRLSCVRKAICPYFSSSRHTPPVDFTWPSIFPAYAGAGLGRRSSIRLRISRNRFRGTATSANWNVTYRPWLTTLEPIFTSFSRSVVSDPCSTSFGNADVSFGSKADIPRHSRLCPLLGAKQTSNVRFLSPKRRSVSGDYDRRRPRPFDLD